MEIKELSNKIFKNAIEKGLCRDIPETVAWLHSEVSEIYEAFKKKIKAGEPGWIGQEIADVVILALSLSEQLRIDIGKEIADKMEINLSRDQY